MTATSASFPTDLAHTPSILLEADHNRAHVGSRAHPAHTIRADRADARWSVRVVLEGTATAAGDITNLVWVIIHDRDSGIFPVFRVWSDWRDPAILATHITMKPLTEALRGAEADHLAEALMAWLTGDAAASITALTLGDAARDRMRLTARRQRVQPQLLRRIEWDE